MSIDREIKRETVAKGRFLKYVNIFWRDKYGEEKIWESLERLSDSAEAVMIIPWIVESQELVIIKQYRPPAKGYVYEFPAGLIDKGESPEVAAIRELKEETGYSGEVVSIVAPTFNTPGMSGEAVYLVFMELPVQQQPKMDLQDSEDIDVVTLSRANVKAFLDAEIAKEAKFDSKLFMYLNGLIS